MLDIVLNVFTDSLISSLKRWGSFSPITDEETEASRDCYLVSELGSWFSAQTFCLLVFMPSKNESPSRKRPGMKA